MDRPLTRAELQRCINIANEITCEEPAENDAATALECLTSPSEDDSAWAHIVTTEAARILAGDGCSDDRTIKRLRELARSAETCGLPSLARDLAPVIEAVEADRARLAECERERDAALARLAEVEAEQIADRESFARLTTDAISLSAEIHDALRAQHAAEVARKDTALTRIRNTARHMDSMTGDSLAKIADDALLPGGGA